MAILFGNRPAVLEAHIVSLRDDEQGAGTVRTGLTEQIPDFESSYEVNLQETHA